MPRTATPPSTAAPPSSPPPGQTAGVARRSAARWRASASSSAAAATAEAETTTTKAGRIRGSPTRRRGPGARQVRRPLGDLPRAPFEVLRGDVSTRDEVERAAKGDDRLKRVRVVDARPRVDDTSAPPPEETQRRP